MVPVKTGFACLCSSKTIEVFANRQGDTFFSNVREPRPVIHCFAMTFQITHCLCFDISFAELKKIADKKQAHTLEELQGYEEFGKRCRLCHPYVKRMLKTGETVFTEIVED